MPKVKVHNYSCSGLQPVHGKVNININAAGVFSVKLPGPVAEMFGSDLINGRELGKVEREFDKLLKEFSEAQTIEEKVIVCLFAANAYITRATEKYPDDDGCVILSRNDISFCEGTAICLYVQVYNKMVTKRKGENLVRYKRIDSNIPLVSGRYMSDFRDDDSEGYYILPWTEEREAFFVNVMTAMEEMIIKLDEVFKTKKGLTALIDSGGFNLLGDGNVEG